MDRRYPICIIAVAAAWFGTLGPAAGAEGGRVVVDGITEGRYTDPFLNVAEALVRSEGFKGDFSNLVGLSGLADEATMCRQDCDCRETLHSAERLKELLAPLGGSVTRYDEAAAGPQAAWGVLERELKAGRPVAAEGLAGATSLDLIVGCDPQKQTVIYLDHGKRLEESFAEWTKGEWSFSTAQLGTTRLPQGKAELQAVAKMLVHARQPRIEDGCSLRDDGTQNALGLEAYSLWSEEVKAEASPDPTVKGLRVKAWVERRRMLEKFLRNAAGHQNANAARRLQDAADSVHGELTKGLLPLAATTPFPATAGAQQKQRDPKLRERQSLLMRVAGSFQAQFLRKIEPLVFRQLRLPKKAWAAASLKGTSAKVDAATVRGLLKSSDPLVRTLGAVTAERSGDAGLAPDLEHSLRSEDAVEARSALAALKAVKPENLDGMLHQEVAAMKSAGGKAAEKDSIRHQMECSIDDLEGRGRGGFVHNLMVRFLHGPTLIGIAVLAVAGLAFLAWKLFGPKRLATKVDDAFALRKAEMPADAALLEALMARPLATGLLLTHVARGGMAEKQGLKRGDIVVRYGGEPISSLEDLRNEVLKPGPRQREIVGRRGRRTVTTVVVNGSLGLGGVAVTRGEMFWKRLPALPYAADFTGVEGDGEAWYRLTRQGQACGFEWRRWRWIHDEMEVTYVTGLAGEEGEESVRVTQRLRAAESLACVGTKLVARGRHTVEMDASCSSERWLVFQDGQPVAGDFPTDGLPSHAMAIFAGSLPLQAGRAYNVVRIDELDFMPSWGCQIVCLGSEMIDLGDGDESAWRFELMEYGIPQMTFWFNPQRQLIRADYAGLASTRTTREAALADLPDSIRKLAVDPSRKWQAEAVPAEAPGAEPQSVAGVGTGSSSRPASRQAS